MGDAKVVKVNPNVVTRMRKRFGNQVVQAVNENNSQLAADVYADTLNLPQTSTENILRNDSGYLLNGQFFNNPDLVTCYRDCKVYLLKMLRPNEIECGRAFYKAIESDIVTGTFHEHITPFEIHEVHDDRVAMIMPAYPTTLETIPYLTPPQCCKILSQIASALEYFHKKGFAYMDMKPTNVCFNYEGDVVLIDLGSVVVLGNMTSSCTAVYLPSDMQIKNGRYKASSEIDWWMLVVTMLEKMNLVNIGGALNTPQRKELANLFPDVEKCEVTAIMNLLKTASSI